MRSCFSSGSILLIVLTSALSMWAQTGNAKPPGAYDRNPANMASPYVPLDSWVYAAIDRLAALGYVQTDFVGQRPWTRMECARLLAEADERAASDDSNTESIDLYRALTNEFAMELRR